MLPPWLLRVITYLGLAVWLTWPAAASIGTAVPGAARTDIWNSLWSLWFFQHGLWSGGTSPVTDLINFPDGGVLVVADPVNALLGAPLIPLLGVPATYTLLVLFQLTLAGLCAHAFAEELLLDRDGAIPQGTGLIAGVGFASAPILLSGVHNGTSESFAGGWAALAIWLCWRAARLGGTRRVAAAVMGLVVASLASWYTGAVCFFFAAALVVAPPATDLRKHLRARLAVVGLGVLSVAPFAALVRWAEIGRAHV